MIPYRRQDRIQSLCIVCTVFMFVTSMFNIMYIVRRSLSPNVNNYTPTSMSSITRNTTLKTANSTSPIKDDYFEKTYKTFLHSFVQSYLSAGDNRSVPLNYCPAVPPDLQGPLLVSEVPTNFSLATNSSRFPDVKIGGQHQPKLCLARHKVAIIVPYRDRVDILKHFLYHTHQILQRQQLDYRIYVCEQAFDKTFNKGIVMNGCFKEILKLQPKTPCFIMHDVDLLLIDDRNMYTCPTFPRHLSVAIDKFHFYLPYAQLVGGVLGKGMGAGSSTPMKYNLFAPANTMRREHYLLVNGYSTNYWGWGGEDDDMHARIINKHLKVERPPVSVARYRMLKHTHQKLNPARMKVLRNAQVRIDSDGVNNVKYKLLNTTFHHLYTHFLIDVGEEPK